MGKVKRKRTKLHTPAAARSEEDVEASAVQGEHHPHTVQVGQLHTCQFAAPLVSSQKTFYVTIRAVINFYFSFYSPVLRCRTMSSVSWTLICPVCSASWRVEATWEMMMSEVLSPVNHWGDSTWRRRRKENYGGMSGWKVGGYTREGGIMGTCLNQKALTQGATGLVNPFLVFSWTFVSLLLDSLLVTLLV